MGTRLKEQLAKGRLTKVFGLGQVCHPKFVELVGLLGGFDAVWLDQEHTGISLEQIENAVRAARLTGLDSFVRIAPTDYAAAMRPLEAGAGGVMAAMVRSAAQADEFLRWTKFHPHGLRGVNGTGADGNFGTMPLKPYFEKANAETFIAIQIEHIDAVNEVEKIAAIPNVDVLFVGPADLSQSMGIPGEWEHPRLWEAIDRVARAAKEHRIHWAILPLNPEHARRSVEMGCRMLAIGMDVWAIGKGLRAYQGEYGEFLGK